MQSKFKLEKAMDENNEYQFIPDKFARFERTPESFITLCRLIKNQEIQYGDAWDIVKDLVKANIWRDEQPF